MITEPYTAAPTRYDGRMPYRRCGKSGLLLPEISLGFWHNFGDSDDLTEGRAVMHHAFDQGITHFDFANNYGPPYGSAESNCGTILKSDFAPYRDQLVISTKAGHDMWPGPYGEWSSRKSLLASLDQSLKRLQLDYVDIFYSHRPDPDTPLEETMGALATAVNSGRALYAGISKYPLPMLKDAVAILQSMGVRTLIYQPPLSLLDSAVVDSGLTTWLQENGIGCIAFSPLAQGLLTEKYRTSTIPSDSRATSPSPFLDLDRVQEKAPILDSLHRIAQQRGTSLQHLALKWVSQQPGITSTLIGARTRAQLQDNLDSLTSTALNSEELHSIRTIISS